jgi:AraC-like DNA-binding protein
MNWVKFAYFSALTIGITAMLSSFFPMNTDWIVTIIFSAFYFIFAQEYIKYNKVFSIVEPAINNTITDNPPVQLRSSRSDWEYYKQRIQSNKQYLVQGITIEEIANNLKISRTTLSNLINREEGVNFNTWINRLRIEDAKNLMIDNPDFTILQISEMVGYTEQANFSRQFKQITGESPLVWRKRLAAS